MKNNRFGKTTKYINNIFTYSFLTIAAIVSLFPFYWMISASTNKSIDVALGKLSLGKSFIENLNKLSQVVNIKEVLLNSFQIAILSTVLCLLICSLAGYGFEIYKSKWKERLFNLLLMSMMLPFAAIMVPLFKLINKLGLMNTLAAVIIPASASAFLVFFFRQNTKAFQKELLEAARVDGLNEFQIFFRIFMPTMKSTYAAAAIITFMGSWNNYLWPLIVLQDKSKMTIPLSISILSSGPMPDYAVTMLAVIISVIPTITIFFLLQKHFVEGMVGSVK